MCLKFYFNGFCIYKMTYLNTTDFMDNWTWLNFAFLQNKTLSGVGMDSVVEPLDVSIEDFPNFSLRIYFHIKSYWFLFLKVEIKYQSQPYIFDNCMCVEVWNSNISSHTLLWLHVLVTKHVPVSRATAKSPPSQSSFITRRRMFSSRLVSLNQ